MGMFIKIRVRGGAEMRNLKNLNIIINTNSLRFIGIEVEFQKLNNIFKYY